MRYNEFYKDSNSLISENASFKTVMCFLRFNLKPFLLFLPGMFWYSSIHAGKTQSVFAILRLKNTEAVESMMTVLS